MPERSEPPHPNPLPAGERASSLAGNRPDPSTGPESETERAGALRRAVRDAAAMLAFFGRIRIPYLSPPRTGFRFAEACWAAPLAGLALGTGASLVLLGAAALRLPPWVAATLAVVTLVLLSGGLHEDGLADIADGFGGGRTRERKLAIMRDSRLGTFGALALILSVLLRVGALAHLLEASAVAAAAALVAAAAVSRAASLWPLHALPPARADGLAVEAGRPARGKVVRAALVAAGLTVIVAVPALGPAAGLSGLAAAAFAAQATTALARRQIGGATGDVAGAAQQTAEIAFLLGALISFP